MTKLKWDGDALMLGKTKMAEVRTMCEGLEYDYIIGPGDTASEPVKSKDVAREECMAEVKRLLDNAGAQQ